ncbi:enoyl-CoA hydratase/isomerase family protein [Aquimarina sp. BL5]|uniref:enoyl-CoA hydratase/isomerase family protein n=1 Tax=Aquimarina sp. BL5 TaxID=1714860 RepID=UPI000E4EA12D|nr:enoyl-CoA hydratase/isomerase family protein [Aquimarina sp. BL5]AXT52120.1 enoyl-CoA hydratase/isomerase family protein [Aquimarina sp. BL5]RKN10776.1 enoyl-CoA hydratase/isomerase family protein [Aquimarina sp. BL5]
MTTTRTNGSLYTHSENHIATVEFGHPASNSFPSELLERLTNAINTLSNDPSIHVIILKSEGEKAFCAGASFDELVAITNLEEGKKFFSGFANVINSMRKCKQPILGRIQGKTVGGGVGLASACDYCMATEAASIKLSELTIGIGPFVIEPAVSRKIGLAAFEALAWDASQWKNAYWAKEKGVFTRVFETITELDKEVQLFAEKLASYNPQAIQAMKEVNWKGTDHWDKLLTERAEVSGELVLSKFTKDALEKFKK